MTIYFCVACRSVRGTLGEQMMPELRSDRLQNLHHLHIAIWTYLVLCHQKLYENIIWVMFTCICSRAIHMDIVVFRNWFFPTFLKIYKETQYHPPHEIRHCTNFVDTIKERWEAFQEMDHNQLSQNLQTHGAIWIT